MVALRRGEAREAEPEEPPALDGRGGRRAGGPVWGKDADRVSADPMGSGRRSAWGRRGTGMSALRGLMWIEWLRSQGVSAGQGAGREARVASCASRNGDASMMTLVK